MSEVAEGEFSRERAIPRERLSDEELGNLISAIGNSEVKAMDLIAMKNSEVYTKGGFDQLGKEVQGENPGWLMSRGNMMKYATDSLAPIGFVARGVVDRNRNLAVHGYIKTSFGESVGVSAAGLFLDFSKNYPDFALIDLFGSAQSPPNKDREAAAKSDYRRRGPITRKDIFWELTTADLPIREADLAIEMHVDESTIRSQLIELARRGIILLERPQRGNKPFVFYRLSATHPQEDPEPFPNMRPMTKSIHQIFQNEPDRQFTTDEIIEKFLQSLPEEQRARLTYKALRSNVSSITNHLNRSGYLERGKYSKESGTEINLTPEQRLMLIEMVRILDGIQNQDRETITRGQEYARYFMSHPADVSALFAKAREHSRYTDRQSREDTGLDLITIISANPGKSAEDLSELLESTGKKLGLGGTSEILGILVENGKIEYKLERGVRMFNVVKPSETEDEVDL